MSRIYLKTILIQDVLTYSLILLEVVARIFLSIVRFITRVNYVLLLVLAFDAFLNFPF